MMLDGHIHTHSEYGDRDELLGRLEAAGLEGGLLISPPPAGYLRTGVEPRPQERLEKLLWWCEAAPQLYPAFWIDPLEENALEQVEVAGTAGAAAFKVICDRFYPGDERPMEVFRAIAGQGLPILFHSGILWNSGPSANYNRPGNFEALLEVNGLRFCLAHISWPWCDELLAVYGKLRVACRRSSGLEVEMFIDTTPGTPPIYRRQALTRLFRVEYEVEDNLIFGSDGSADDYSTKHAREWIKRDTRILEGIGAGEDVRRKIFGANLRRFLGVD